MIDICSSEFSSPKSNAKLTAAAAAKLLQSCPTLCDPIDGNPPGSAVPGILQARTLEWAAISFSRKYSSPSKTPGAEAGTGKGASSKLAN